jgi:hypothetical protein
LSFLGTRLSLNVDSAKGKVEVEMLDRQGQPVAGHSRADCVPVAVDSTRCAVRWKESPDLLGLAEEVSFVGDRSRVVRQPVRLRFHLTDAKLYSFCID